MAAKKALTKKQFLKFPQYKFKPYSPVLLLVQTVDDWNAVCEFLDIPETVEEGRAAGLTLHLCGRPKNKFIIVGVFDGSLKTLVHELAHAVMFVMEFIGTDPRGEGQEAFAYSLDNAYGFAAPLLKKIKDPFPANDLHKAL